MLREIKRAGLPLRVFYSARYAAITCARKMAALNKTRTPTPNATIELTVWPGPTSASDTRAAQASERSVRYLNRALAADAGFASTEAPPAAWLFAIRTVDLDQARGGFYRPPVTGAFSYLCAGKVRRRIRRLFRARAFNNARTATRNLDLPPAIGVTPISSPALPTAYGDSGQCVAATRRLFLIRRFARRHYQVAKDGWIYSVII